MKTSPIIVLASLCIATLALHAQPVMHARQQNVSGTPLNNQARFGSGPRTTAVPNSQVYLPDSLTLYSMSDTLLMSASYDPRG